MKEPPLPGEQGRLLSSCFFSKPFGYSLWFHFCVNILMITIIKMFLLPNDSAYAG